LKSNEIAPEEALYRLTVTEIFYTFYHSASADNNNRGDLMRYIKRFVLDQSCDVITFIGILYTSIGGSR